MELKSLYIRDFERNDGITLHLSQCEIGDVGCVVWDSAIVLAKYLETVNFHSELNDYFKKNEKELIKNKEQNRNDNLLSDLSYLFNKLSIVELGSGTGIVGIQAACMGLLINFI